jgi:hypothetical protein
VRTCSNVFRLPLERLSLKLHTDTPLEFTTHIVSLVEGRYFIKDNVVQKISIFSALSGLPSEEQCLKLKCGTLSLSALNFVFYHITKFAACESIFMQLRACHIYIYIYIYTTSNIYGL